MNLRTRVHLIQKNILDFIKERRTVKLIHAFRNYSAFIIVVSSALLVSTTNLAAGKESSGFLFGYFGSKDNFESPLKDKLFLTSNQKNNLALVPLAQAKTNPDPNFQEDTEEQDLATVQGQALLAGNSPVRKDPEEDGGVEVYEVKTGDTVSSIASSHKISVNTILWANELDNVDSIMPGDKIFILPVSGISYTVKSGDDIEGIAKKYKSDKEKIIAFNSLPANGELKEGDEIIIPDGQKDIPKPAPTVTSPTDGYGIASRPYDTFQTPGKTLSSGSKGHSFPYGYCTWYVAQRRTIPWSGNAGTWLYHARSAGYSTGKTPRVGAVIVTSESWWGHVGIVEKVSGGSVTISEMNYKGWAKKSTRTIDTSSRVIKGFIY